MKEETPGSESSDDEGRRPRQTGAGAGAGRRHLRRRASYLTKDERNRARLLNEWRGTAERPSLTRNVKTLGDLVPDLVGSLGLKDRFAAEDIERFWVELVGEFNASLSRPVKVFRDVLYVQVTQPTAMYHLERTMKAELLRKVQAKFGEDRIRDVRFTG